MLQDRIPSVDECKHLWEQHQMAPNIKDHSLKVRDVAVQILNHIKDKHLRERLAPLVEPAALLHDITKTRSLKTHECHEYTAGVLLRTHGFETIAHAVEQHVDIQDFDPFAKELTVAEIVCYSDKRVMHDRVVTLEDRRNDLIARYCRTQEDANHLEARFVVYRQVEQKIINALDCTLSNAIPT